MDNLPNPTTIDINSTICAGVDNHPNITGSRLMRGYLSGSVNTLTRDNSPYYVAQNILIQTNAILKIENGVEIIYSDDSPFICRYEIMDGLSPFHF